jgi:hypothetical protein
MVWRVIQTIAASRAKTALHWRYRLYMLDKQDIGYLFLSTSGSEHVCVAKESAHGTLHLFIREPATMTMFRRR